MVGLKQTRYDRPGGYLRKDWRLLLGLHLAIPAILVVTICVVPVMVRARDGDLTLFWVALASAVTGIVLLFSAKWPLYRQGKYFTFGSKALPKGCRRVYRIAYVFIGASLLTMLLLLAILR